MPLLSTDFASSSQGILQTRSEMKEQKAKGPRGGGRRIVMITSIALVLAVTIRSSQGQPFLNSLAVLFRARPPWPTTFPSSKFTPLPAPLLNQAGSSQGILVAHPINPSSSPGSADSGSMKGKKPDTLESVGPVLPSPQGGSPFIPIPSMPSISSLIPMFPPPIPLFQNSHVLGVGVASPTSTIHSSGNNNINNNNNNNNQKPPGGSSGGIPPPPPLPSQSNNPVLVASPTSLVGSISDPPVTAPNPNYGVLLENTNFQHKPHKKQKFRGGDAWNPLPAAGDHSNSPYDSSSNNNYQHAGQSSASTHLEYSKESYSTENARKQKKLKDFRPSPQLNTFLETTVISDYGSHIAANGGYNLYGNDQGNGPSNKEYHHGEKPVSFQAGEAKNFPRLESGFRPISFDQYASNFGSTATKPHYTNSHQQYFNPWSIAFNPNNPNNNNPEQSPNQQEQQTAQVPEEIRNPQSHNDNNHIHSRGEKPFRKDRQILTGAAVSQSVGNSASQDVSAEDGRSSSEEEDAFAFLGSRGKKKSSEQQQKEKHRQRFSSKGKKYHGVPATISSTTASSELVEEWLPPGIRIEKKSDIRKKFPIYNAKRLKPIPKPGPTPPKGMMKLPEKCEKFNRYGFCPVTKQYPLDAAEKIASRCTALMSHLIAPLPKMDVQYDIGRDAGGKNGTRGKGRSTSGWSWRSFQGKPVCDTDELAVLPGWARNENGDWMIILQTKIWQQKAHISLCSPMATQCQGLACQTKQHVGGNRKDDQQDSLKYSKCVQRFTAQRLAVFDPEDPDRCPVVRSVFLPSACVCLTTTTSTSGRESSTSGSGERDHQEHHHQHQAASHFSHFSSRQPLFSSSSSSSNDEDNESIRNDEDAVGAAGSSYPADSREALLVAQASLERSKSIVGQGGIGSNTDYSAQAGSSSLETNPRAGMSHQRSSSSGSSRSHSFESAPISNATFMIITEKFTTNESSKETTDLLPQGLKTVNGTRSVSSISSSSSSSSSS